MYRFSMWKPQRKRKVPILRRSFVSFDYRRSDWTTYCNNCNDYVPKGVMIKRIDRTKWAHYFDFECGKEVIPKSYMNRNELQEIHKRLLNKEAIENWNIDTWISLYESGQLSKRGVELNSESSAFQSVINYLDPERIFLPKSQFMSTVMEQNSPTITGRKKHYNGSNTINWFLKLHGTWINEYLFSAALELDGLSKARIGQKQTNELISIDGSEEFKLIDCIDLNELVEYQSICKLIENYAKGDYQEDCKEYILNCMNAKSQIVRIISEMFATGNLDMEKEWHSDRYFLANYRYLDPERLTPIDFRTHSN